MVRSVFIACLIFIPFLATCRSTDIAEKVVWKGEVLADGTPSQPIQLKLHHEYKVKTEGFVNLGKWKQGGEQLANDACYEFNTEGELAKLESLRNTSGISVCDGKYHPDHIYHSETFTAEQDKIHFWVHDFNYDDNSGAFKVQILQVGS